MDSSQVDKELFIMYNNIRRKANLIIISRKGKFINIYTSRKASIFLCIFSILYIRRKVNLIWISRKGKSINN